MHTAQAASVVRHTISAPRRAASSAASFASGLRDGLVDLAYAFDGAFRATGSLSLAERAAYGLWSHVGHAAATGASGVEHRTPIVGPIRRASPEIARRTGFVPFLRPGAQKVMNTRPVLEIEGHRREAALRRASSSDVPAAPTRPRVGASACNARVSASVGSARIDVLVSGRSGLVSVMQWMR